MNNNFGPMWSHTPFKSKEEARKFCLSKKCESEISSLDGLAYSLHEKGLTETPVQHGHGYPLESPSSLEASYISSEANRLRDLRRYFKGNNAKPGYKWVYSTHGLHSVHQEIDLSNVSPKHPVFLEYVKNQKLSKKDHDEAYQVWLRANTEGGMNNAFRMAYHFKMKDLIPDDYSLGPIKKK